MTRVKRDCPPFTMIENRVVDDHELSLHAFATYVTLCRFADTEQKCFPSLATIARVSRISRRKAVDAVGELIGRGYLRKDTRVREGTSERDSNIYTILWGGAPGAPRGAGDAPGSAGDAPQVVHEVHGGGAHGAQELYLENKTHKKNSQPPVEGYFVSRTVLRLPVRSPANRRLGCACSRRGPAP